MKKILSFLAGIAVVGVALTNGVSCTNSLFEKQEVLKGTNGAKIALARERLNENVFSEKLSFWEEKESAATVKASSNVKTSSAVQASATMQASTTVQPTAVSLGAMRERTLVTPVSDKYAVQDGEVRWTTFGNNSLTMDNFQNVFNEIEIDAAQVAESIGNIKKYVGVTDKWVGGNQLLQVEENRETLAEKYYFEDPNISGYQVAHRYTREDAKNVYDIYGYWQEDKESGELRMKYISGEYYESSYIHSSGFNDYFLAENSSGYWKLSRSNYTKGENGENCISVSHYVLKDGLGIGFFCTNLFRGEEEPIKEVVYDFFDTTTGQDLFRASVQGSGYVVSTYLGNVKSGLAYIEADEKDTFISDGICTNQVGMAGRLVFANGKVGESTEDVQVDGVDINYDYMYKKYYGQASMYVQADSLIHSLEKTDAYWRSYGATLNTELSSLSAAVDYAQSLSDTFEETFEWNGYKAASIGGMEKAENVLKDFFKESSAKYEEVKNYETIENISNKVTIARFAAVDTLNAAQSAYANGKITLNNASLTISDSTFLEAGREYVLKVGLALKNADGLQSVNTVALETASESKTVYAEGATSLTVTQSGEYEVPLNLSEGNYAVVAYVATADEGIRVSEMKEIAFGEISEGEVASSAMKIDVKKSNETITLHYGVKLSVQADIQVQESYTAEDIKRALTRAILIYGYPITGESVTTANGEPVTEETMIEAGTYKVKFYINTEDGMAEAYAYLTIE